ncbi:hydrogenase maturation nickel metallochaperone HypA [bacterium]|nr:hydrogenase maturation nickel metallochaperone HypA [bacterium]
MHEFSLAQNILEIVIDSAREHGLTAVGEVRLDVGQAAGVHLEALEFAWKHLKTTSELTTGAALLINSIPAHAACANCGFSGPVTDYIRICPACQALGLRIMGGLEFMVTSISGE